MLGCGLLGVLAADGPTSVVGGVRLPAAREVKAMGHRTTVLALPVPFPLDAMPLLDALPVDLEGDAMSPPLLQFALSLSMGGAATSEAGLGFAIVLEVVLAGPVPICAGSPGEVYRAVRAESLLAPRPTWPVEPGKGTVLVVGGDEETLPGVDFAQPP